MRHSRLADLIPRCDLWRLLMYEAAMNLEALWTMECVTDEGIGGTGIAVFETGRIFGGDSAYYYIGRFEVSGEVLSGELTVTHYAGPRSPVFRPLERLMLSICGRLSEPVMYLTGHPNLDPQRTIRFTCTKREDLPSGVA